MSSSLSLLRRAHNRYIVHRANMRKALVGWFGRPRHSTSSATYVPEYVLESVPYSEYHGRYTRVAQLGHGSTGVGCVVLSTNCKRPQRQTTNTTCLVPSRFFACLFYIFGQQNTELLHPRERPNLAACEWRDVCDVVN